MVTQKSHSNFSNFLALIILIIFIIIKANIITVIAVAISINRVDNCKKFPRTKISATIPPKIPVPRKVEIDISKPPVVESIRLG